MNPILTTLSSIQCPHGGTAILTTANTVAQIDGGYALLLTMRTVVGCPFTTPVPQVSALRHHSLDDRCYSGQGQPDAGSWQDKFRPPAIAPANSCAGAARGLLLKCKAKP